MEDVVKAEAHYYTSDDYYDVKRFLELKAKIKIIFQNEKRANDLRAYIKEKNTIKDDMVKISEDSNYTKALGITA